MRVKTRLKRSKPLVLLSLVFAFTFAATQPETNLGGNTRGRATQSVTASTRNVNAVKNRSIVGACRSSIRNTYAYRLNAPEKSKKQPRPGHWFHFIEFHLPLSSPEERSNYLFSDSFDLLLLLPKKSWPGELTPITRFFLAAVYSMPFARREVATVVFPRSIIFLSAESLLHGMHGTKSAKIDGVRASIVTTRSYTWSSTIRQSLLDRFVLDDSHDCGDADQAVEFDTEFISSGAKSGTGFGRVNSPVHEWFATIENVQTMRQSFEMLCQVDIYSDANAIEFVTVLPGKLRETKTGCLLEIVLTVNKDQKKKRQAVIYQRDVNRKFRDFDQVKGDVKRILGSDWSVSVVMHDDNNPPCLLYHCLKNAELLITPHGFQSMLTMFLPTRAYMFEIFPSRYHWTGYKALGLMFGVRHVWVESQPLTIFGRALSAAFTTKRCMTSYFCRYLVRKSDVSFDELSSSTLEKIVEGNMMENAHAHPFRGIIASSSDTLSQCVVDCERVDDCFTVQFAPVCVQFVLPTISL